MGLKARENWRLGSQLNVEELADNLEILAGRLRDADGQWPIAKELLEVSKMGHAAAMILAAFVKWEHEE